MYQVDFSPTYVKCVSYPNNLRLIHRFHKRTVTIEVNNYDVLSTDITFSEKYDLPATLSGILQLVNHHCNQATKESIPRFTFETDSMTTEPVCNTLTYIHGRVNTGPLSLKVKGQYKPTDPTIVSMHLIDKRAPEIVTVILEKLGLLKHGEVKLQFKCPFFSERTVRCILCKNTKKQRTVKAALRLLTLNQLLTEE